VGVASVPFLPVVTAAEGASWRADLAHAQNWGETYRWALTGIAGLLVLNSTFASSAPSGIITPLRTEFGFSQEVAVLTISLFVAGYCVGPLLWGPLSESIYGRRPIFIGTFITYTGFQIGCALAPNTAAILVFRFLGGVFAAAPLTNSGALLADIWDGDHRGQAMSSELGSVASGCRTAQVA
jgi:MFS family permease